MNINFNQERFSYPYSFYQGYQQPNYLWNQFAYPYYGGYPYMQPQYYPQFNQVQQQYNQQQQSGDGVHEILPYTFEHHFTHHRNQESNVKNALMEALNGEYEAITCYEVLLQQTSDNEAKEIIQGIREEEIIHYNGFLEQYRRLFNAEPQINQQISCPNDYKAGLLLAFKDEQNTVDKYLKNADVLIDNKELKQLYERYAKDEQNHAVDFLYLMTK